MSGGKLLGRRVQALAIGLSDVILREATLESNLTRVSKEATKNLIVFDKMLLSALESHLKISILTIALESAQLAENRIGQVEGIHNTLERMQMAIDLKDGVDSIILGKVGSDIIHSLFTRGVRVGIRNVIPKLFVQMIGNTLTGLANANATQSVGRGNLGKQEQRLIHKDLQMHSTRLQFVDGRNGDDETLAGANRNLRTSKAEDDRHGLAKLLIELEGVGNNFKTGMSAPCFAHLVVKLLCIFRLFVTRSAIRSGVGENCINGSRYKVNYLVIPFVHTFRGQVAVFKHLIEVFFFLEICLTIHNATIEHAINFLLRIHGLAADSSKNSRGFSSELMLQNHGLEVQTFACREVGDVVILEACCSFLSKECFSIFGDKEAALQKGDKRSLTTTGATSHNDNNDFGFRVNLEILKHVAVIRVITEFVNVDNFSNFHDDASFFMLKLL